MSECGCSIELAPCEAHQATLGSGEQTAHITVQFDDKYSRFKGNGHRVNLERVQRIELGIDAEPMEFSEITLANMLQKMADDRPFEHEAFVLRALANSLRGEDDDHQLVLKQKKPGKWQTPTESEEKDNRDLSWLWTLGGWEHEGMKTEAAVARISELSGFSRASVFAGIKRAERFLDLSWSIGGKARFGPRPQHLTNPRPANKRST